MVFLNIKEGHSVFGTLCPLGRFVLVDILSMGHFVPRDVLSLGRGSFLDVLSLPRFVSTGFPVFPCRNTWSQGDDRRSPRSRAGIGEHLVTRSLQEKRARVTWASAGDCFHEATRTRAGARVRERV
jgi:hypothetical protein